MGITYKVFAGWGSCFVKNITNRKIRGQQAGRGRQRLTCAGAEGKIEQKYGKITKRIKHMRLRRIAAIWAAKIAQTASVRLFHRQGVTWAGKIAMQLCPDILKELASQVREEIYVVCGTNGKTTTNNMLCAALEAEGKKVVCNHTGSNMLNGVVAAFVLAAGWSGRLDADCACIEIDEASTRRVFPYFKPDYMVLTNLFRDQLDRYGEIDITMDILKKAMRSAPDMTVIVNGDDALSAFLAMDAGTEDGAFLDQVLIDPGVSSDGRHRQLALAIDLIDLAIFAVLVIPKLVLFQDVKMGNVPFPEQEEDGGIETLFLVGDIRKEGLLEVAAFRMRNQTKLLHELRFIHCRHPPVCSSLA